MDHAKLQRVLSLLVDHLLPHAAPADRERVVSYIGRVAASAFSEEPEGAANIEVKMMQAVGGDSARLLALVAALKAKKTLQRPAALCAVLLKARESADRSLPSFVSSGNSKWSALGEQPTTLTNLSLAQSAHLAVARVDDLGLARGLVWALQAIPSEQFAFDRGVEQFVPRGRFEQRVGVARRAALVELAEAGWLFLKVSTTMEIIAKRVNALTAQALLSATQDELTHYYRFLAAVDTLEKTGGLELTGLAALLGEQQTRLRLLAHILEASLVLSSTELLSFLHALAQSAFVPWHAFLTAMLRKTARSFVEFVVTFAETGEVLDPMGEFFVRMDAGGETRGWLDNAAFLARRVPLFFESRWARLVFEAGRVNRALVRMGRETDGQRAALTVDNFFEADAPVSVGAKLERVYAANNRRLLRHIREHQRLQTVVAQVVAIFLLARGDFAETLIESLEAEVGLRALPTALRHQLAYSFEAALKVSFRPRELLLPRLAVAAGQEKSCASDCLINFAPQHDALPFPLNSIFSAESASLLQGCFQHLFTLRIHQHGLRKCWQMHARQRVDDRTAALLTLGWHLRMKILAALDALGRHWAVDIVERRTRALVERLGAADSLDALIDAYRGFVEAVHREVTFTGAATAAERSFGDTLAALFAIARNFTRTQEVIFQTLQANIQFESSFDSIEHIENPRVHDLAALNDAFIAEVRERLTALGQQLNENVSALIRLADNRRLDNLLDFNDYYLHSAAADKARR